MFSESVLVHSKLVWISFKHQQNVVQPTYLKPLQLGLALAAPGVGHFEQNDQAKSCPPRVLGRLRSCLITSLSLPWEASQLTHLTPTTLPTSQTTSLSPFCIPAPQQSPICLDTFTRAPGGRTAPLRMSAKPSCSEPLPHVHRQGVHEGTLLHRPQRAIHVTAETVTTTQEKPRQAQAQEWAEGYDSNPYLAEEKRETTSMISHAMHV